MSRENTHNIYPDMTVRDIGLVALDLGCEVIHGNKPGDITLKHPEIKTSISLSADDNNPGTLFASWAQPLIANDTARLKSISMESRQGQIAAAIQRMSYPGKVVQLDAVVAEFQPAYTRKQIADSISHLVRKGYVERHELGEYKTTPMLDQIIKMSLDNEDKVEHAEHEQEPVKESIKEPVKDKPETGDKDKKPVELDSLESFIVRLEKAVDRLEVAAGRLHDYSEFQDAMDVMEKALTKAKKK